MGQSTPEEVVHQLSELLKKAVATQGFVAFGHKFCFDLVYLDRAEMDRLLQDEVINSTATKKKYLEKE